MPSTNSGHFSMHDSREVINAHSFNNRLAFLQPEFCVQDVSACIKDPYCKFLHVNFAVTLTS